MRILSVKKILVVVFFLLLTKSSIAQIKLGNAATQLEKSALLELNGNRQGLLLPRLTDTTVINSLNPPDGMLIYFTPATAGKGLYIRKSGFWQRMTTDSVLSANLNSWTLTGNSGLTGTEKLGPTGAVSLNIITANINRIIIDGSGNTTLTGNTTLNGTLNLNPATGTITDLSALILNGSNTVIKRTLNNVAFNGAIQSLNGLTAATQTFATTNLPAAIAFSTNSGTIHNLNIPDADVSNRGIISTGIQSFAGNKTFTNNLSVSGTTVLSPIANITDTSFLMITTANNQVTKRNVTTLPYLQSLNGLTATAQTFGITNNAAAIAFNTSGGTIHNLNIPDADASNRGTVNTGTQSFAGAKTFNSSIIVNNSGTLGTSGLTLPKLTSAVSETSGAKSIGVDANGNVVRTTTSPNYYTTGGAATITKIWVGQQANSSSPGTGTITFDISSASFSNTSFNVQATTQKNGASSPVQLPFVTVTSISTTQIIVKLTKGVALALLGNTMVIENDPAVIVHLRVEGN
jgi:hypothetical protein